ncbi:type VI secretion system-associated protein TagF [Pseudorhodoferax sp.]|uniref:type VI secretion system-associated protein TagF n=1 Tax=Pseudorhodoferax sp. TaxID=1993553 RepID=UPI0039E266FE
MNGQPLLYFGKLPSRGDFVRSAHAPGLIQTLDRWLTSGVEALAVDPRWKEVYDQARPAHFAFLGSHNPHGLVGHLLASRDASGRRFPFITAARLETDAPLAFLARSPLALSRAWLRLGAAARNAHDAADAGPALGELAGIEVAVESAANAYDASLRDFLDMQTVSGLTAMLAQAGHVLDLRQLVLGLGLLLQPLPASGAHSLDRGLLLPLPADPLYRSLVAALWLDLVAGFLARADFELALFLPTPDDGPPVLALGFDGASARSLHALLDPAFGREVYIDTRDAAWVEEHLGQDYGVHKLSTYLAQGGMSLRQAVQTFKEAFLGS